MLTLYQFAPVWGLPNASSFCLKLETYLRMTQIPFEIASNADFRKAPKGKLPYIVDNGQTIADSSFIIAYLERTYGVNLDQALTPTEKAIARAMQHLMEDSLYWVIVYSRWMEPDNWPKTKAAFFEELPPLLRDAIAAIGRSQIKRYLYSQGLGRHTPTEIYQIGIADLQALADFLADKSFFMGQDPTTVDASAYGILANLLWAPMSCPVREQALKLDNIVAYCERMRSQFYSELKDCGDGGRWK